MKSIGFIHRTFALLMLLIVFCPGNVSAAPGAQTQPAAAPEAVATAFYKYHFAHDMAFTPEEVKHRSAWLTPDLVQECKAYFALPVDPDEVPAIDGDPFTGSQEYPHTFSVGSATVSGDSARVPVTFSWKDGVTTHGAVVLKKVKDRWLIDDVEFPDQDSFRRLLATQSTAAKP